LTLKSNAAGHDLSPADPRVVALATYADGKSAVTSHQLGRGHVIYWSTNPFTSAAAEDQTWRRFWRAALQGMGVKLDRDLWRFKFPPLKNADLLRDDNLCLTNNRIVYEENLPLEKDNLVTGGVYTYSRFPEGVPDEGGSMGYVTFDRGDLTDRKQAAFTRVLGKWVPACDPSPWTVTFKDPGAVSVTFDLWKPHELTHLKLWYSGQLPSLTVEGSSDGQQWTQFARSAKERPTEDVYDKMVALRGAHKYLRLSFGERDQGRTMTLAEVEIHGRA